MKDDFDWLLNDLNVTSVIGFVVFNYRLRVLETLERQTPGARRDGQDLGPAGWDAVNDALQVAGFPYELLSHKDVSFTKDYKPKLRDRTTGILIDFNDLSDGER